MRRNGYNKVTKTFRKRINKNGCWLFLGCKDSSGYGHVMVDGKHKSTHRLSYEIHKGPIPEGMCVCHTCDVRACINPNHLFLGTKKDNARDMVKKGRDAKAATKLTLNEVRQIKELYNTGQHTQHTLAAKFGVGHSCIWDVLAGNHWTEDKTPVTFSRRNLTDNQVKKIREEYATGKIFQKKLAKKYGLSQQYVSQLINGEYRK